MCSAQGDDLENLIAQKEVPQCTTEAGVDNPSPGGYAQEANHIPMKKIRHVVEDVKSHKHSILLMFAVCSMILANLVISYVDNEQIKVINKSHPLNHGR